MTYFVLAAIVAAFVIGVVLASRIIAEVRKVAAAVRNEIEQVRAEASVAGISVHKRLASLENAVKGKLKIK